MRKTILAILLLFVLTSQANRPKVGLVLGGGGAKGGAEVGVLKVLEECGIKPDYIVGTSIGSIVGGLYAAGYTAQELDQLFCQQEWLSLLTDRREDLSNEPFKMINGVTYIFGFPIIDTNDMAFGVLKGNKVEQAIDSMLYAKRCRTFHQLRTPFCCVASCLATMEEVDLNKGALARAIRASMAIPGIFKPVDIDGQKLVDGALMNNLPVDVVKQMGADFVIAVDLQQTKPKPRTEKNNIITDIADLLGIGHIAKWIMNRPDIAKYYENCLLADIYINPALPDYDAASFGNKNMRRMIDIGEQEARKQFYELMKLGEQTRNKIVWDFLK